MQSFDYIQAAMFLKRFMALKKAVYLKVSWIQFTPVGLPY